MKFLDALLSAKTEGKQVVITDIKRYSPKDGELLKNRKPADYARALVSAGAPVVSVVTEEKEFHGSLEMLKEVADAVQVPVLRKDFIHTKEDLMETKEYGASAILLMCSCLAPEELEYLYYEALKLGLDPFVETHTEEDFILVNKLQAKLVGINNRDILKLERDDGDVSLTERLSKYVPEDAFLVTESSIKNPEEVRRAIRSGASAALVGTAIAIAPDIETYYKMLTQKVSLKVCGNMNKEDILKCVEEGVERIGFVTEYPKYVPWNLSKEQSKELREVIPKGFTSVMVTGGGVEHILEMASFVKPDMVQIHYNETLEDTRVITKALKEMGIQSIRSLPMSKEACLEQYGTYDIEAIVKSLCETDLTELLVDPRGGEQVASKNLQTDEALFMKIKEISAIPVTIAGGIKVTNIKDIIENTKTEAVDVMNGSEDEPGKKNREYIKALVSACRI